MSGSRWEEIPTREWLAASSFQNLVSAARADSSYQGALAIEIEGLETTDLRPVGLQGHDAVNRLFGYDVLFAGAVEHRDFIRACMGRRVWLQLSGHHGRRHMTGIVAGSSIIPTHQPRLVYALHIRPKLWILSKVSRRRVFQELSVPDIVAEVLGEHQVPLRRSLARDYRARSYCVQYDETDLAFVKRLLAEEGISSFFELANDEGPQLHERWVLADTSAAYPATDLSAPLAVTPGGTGALQSSQDAIEAFQHGTWLSSDKSTVRSYDYRHAAIPPDPQVHGLRPERAATPPGTHTATAATDAGARLEVYEYGGQDEDTLADEAFAQTRLEQLRRHEQVISLRTPCRKLSAGTILTVVDDEHDQPVQSYLITSVIHQYNSEQNDLRYEAAVECVPAGVCYRPPPPGRRYVQTMETGVVVGLAGESIDPHTHGEVRVQFHWDRSGTLNEHSSCWMRVAQQWAGPSYGFQFVPRIGMEVLVAFIGGDPDRPVVIGCLPNPANWTPMALPQDSTLSTIRSQTVPASAGGYNEIRFEDAAGSQVLGLRAERNLDQYVGKDAFIKIADSRELEIGGSSRIRVDGDQSCAISGTQALRIGGNREQGVAGTERVTIALDRTLRVEGTNSEFVGRGTVTRQGHFYNLIVGEHDTGECSIQVSGRQRLAATNEIQIAAGQRITLRCGQSVLEMRPDAIEVRSQELILAGAAKTSMAGGSCDIVLGPVATIGGPQVTVDGGGAVVNLQGVPMVNKKWVPGGGKAEVGPAAEGLEQGIAIFQIVPPPGVQGPFVLKIAAPSGEVAEHVTDSALQVKVTGHKGDKFVLLEVRYADVVLNHHQRELVAL